MTNKFKIGDSVQVSEKCNDIKEYSWFHRRPMIIIGVSQFYYFTDYWHSNRDMTNTEDIFDGITEECLILSIGYQRKLKLENLRTL